METQRKRLNRIYSGPRGRAISRGYGETFRPIHSLATAFSFKLSSIPGPLGQVYWKDIKVWSSFL